MAPRIDLNLEQQPDDFEETRAEETPEETVIREQRPVTTREGTDDDEGLIPFRTSKRLQGAIYRMIQQRDGKSPGNNTPATKEKTSATPRPSRKVKRQSESLSPVDMDGCETEDKKTRPLADIVREVGCDIKLKAAGSTGSRKRKSKSFTVHFADPLFAFIVDEKEAGQKLLSMSSNGPFLRGRHADGEAQVMQAVKRPTTHTDLNRQQQRIPPASCFDILCNHVGPRGWRCYRSSLEGKSFCRIHDSRKTSSFESGFLQTLRI